MCYWCGASLLSFVVFVFHCFVNVFAIAVEKNRKKASFFSIMSFSSISCFLLQNSYAVQVLLLFSFVLRVPLFWSYNVFFFSKEKKLCTMQLLMILLYLPLPCGSIFATRSNSFFNFCSILPVKTKCLTNQWKKKQFICDVFFFWPLSFFYTSFIHSLRNEKKCEKQQNGAHLWPPW